MSGYSPGVRSGRGRSSWRRAVGARPRRPGSRHQRWLAILPVGALLLGVWAAIAGPSSTFVDAEVAGVSVTRASGVDPTFRFSDPSVGSVAAPSSVVAPAPTSAGASIASPPEAVAAPPVVEVPAPPAEVSQFQPPATEPPATEPPRPEPPQLAAAAAPAPSVADRVLSRITYPWRDRLPGWRIEFVGPRQGYRGATFPSDQLIEIYVRPSASDDELVHVAAHEIGHAVDVTYLEASTRAAFNMARGRSADATWWVANGADDFSSGAGDWAECFAWSQMESGPWYSRLGAPPDRSTMELIRALASG